MIALMPLLTKWITSNMQYSLAEKMMDKMEKAKAGMPQKTSIEISRMIVEEEWQGETGLLMPSSCFKCFSVIC
jgi:hypothetical protein